jgi:hypothetical protein
MTGTGSPGGMLQLGSGFFALDVADVLLMAAHYRPQTANVSPL